MKNEYEIHYVCDSYEIFIVQRKYCAGYNAYYCGCKRPVRVNSMTSLFASTYVSFSMLNVKWIIFFYFYRFFSRAFYGIEHKYTTHNICGFVRTHIQLSLWLGLMFLVCQTRTRMTKRANEQNLCLSHQNCCKYNMCV